MLSSLQNLSAQIHIFWREIFEICVFMYLIQVKKGFRFAPRHAVHNPRPRESRHQPRPVASPAGSERDTMPRRSRSSCGNQAAPLGGLLRPATNSASQNEHIQTTSMRCRTKTPDENRSPTCDKAKPKPCQSAAQRLLTRKKPDPANTESGFAKQGVITSSLMCSLPGWRPS